MCDLQLVTFCTLSTGRERVWSTSQILAITVEFKLVELYSLASSPGRFLFFSLIMRKENVFFFSLLDGCGFS